MKVGYSYWGYLGDTKYDQKGNVASTPDGNAFYSWSIIRELQQRGHSVYQLMPDRDKVGYDKHGDKLFASWLKKERDEAYRDMMKSSFMYDNVSWGSITKEILHTIWDRAGVSGLDLILLEWRMNIPGRNDSKAQKDDPKNFQPDLLIQNALIDYCAQYEIPVILFDLDYKIDEATFDGLVEKNPNTWLFELGTKWEGKDHCKKVYIPFDFNGIGWFNVRDFGHSDMTPNNLVYVGNRYERDWCIDKYIPEEANGVMVYGNWKESGRDSEQRWPAIKFGSRLQTADMRQVYGGSVSTILLAKQEYCDYHFMTARLIEAVFYGSCPLFIEEYGAETIREYAGVFAGDLTVRNKGDVIEKMYELRYNPAKRLAIIGYLREHLKFMHVSHFVDRMMEVARDAV